MNDNQLDLQCTDLAQMYRALLEVSKSIVSNRDLKALFRDLSDRLHAVIDFDSINLVLHIPERNSMRLHILETPHSTTVKTGTELPVSNSASGLVWQTQQPIFVPNIDEENRFPEFISILRENGLRSFCTLPLTTALRRLGALGFGSAKESAYGERDRELMMLVAQQVAVAVDNSLNYEEAQAYQRELARERDHLRRLLEVNNAVVSHFDLQELVAATNSSLHQAISYDYISLVLHEEERNIFKLHALHYPESKGFVQRELDFQIDNSPAGIAFLSRKTVILGEEDLHKLNSDASRILIAEGIKTICCAPLISRARVLGTLNIGSLSDAAFNGQDAELLTEAAAQIAIAVENALAFRQIAELKNKLAEEKLYLEDEIRTEYNFEEIVGDSSPLKRVLKQVEIVAPTDSAVLILGETGTGKELIARAIHNLSARRERTFVKMNCAAIPTGLLESELFGHERGAFTGAVAQKIGRFELANKGTVFLDEIGDIPLELQPKLLRVLQEQEFERLGGIRTIKSDARLVAATNTDLLQMIANKRFRSDLYYRLNVFPINLPPLRDRVEDIPLLVRYFARKYARQMNKRIESVPSEAMEALVKYAWPGNVRELENFIERAVILSQSSALRIPLAELKLSSEQKAGQVSTLEEAEREHILHALRESKWVVGGPAGAAFKLGMKRTTLQSKMLKLGISRQVF